MVVSWPLSLLSIRTQYLRRRKLSVQPANDACTSDRITNRLLLDDYGPFDQFTLFILRPTLEDFYFEQETSIQSMEHVLICLPLRENIMNLWLHHSKDEWTPWNTFDMMFRFIMSFQYPCHWCQLTLSLSVFVVAGDNEIERRGQITEREQTWTCQSRRSDDLRFDRFNWAIQTIHHGRDDMLLKNSNEQSSRLYYLCLAHSWSISFSLKKPDRLKSIPLPGDGLRLRIVTGYQLFGVSRPTPL